jgi:hypothetical protein
MLSLLDDLEQKASACGSSEEEEAAQRLRVQEGRSVTILEFFIIKHPKSSV